MERFFTDRLTLEGLRQSMFWPRLSLIADRLMKDGYSNESIRTRIKVVFDFGRWLRKLGLSERNCSPELVQKFLHYRRKRRVAITFDRVTLDVLLEILEGVGVVKRQEDLHAQTAVERTVEKYVVYLRTERGLSESTIVSYQRIVRCFLSRLFATEEPDLLSLGANDVIAFARWYATAHGKRAKLMGTALRSFFRYAKYQGSIASDLIAAVPKVAQWSLVSIPKALPREQVREVLSACDRTTAIGRRDYAILLLLARLGLRAGEVRSLRLEDIDWQDARITVRGKSGRHLQLPLLHDVGEAIVNYLCDGRPRTDERHVFVSAYAPIKRLRGQASISNIVARALIRAGIDSPRRGAHQFRHSLATEMLRQGASLPEIGEVLGHRNPDTTAIYAKVDLVSLRALAPVWPGGVQ